MADNTCMLCGRIIPEGRYICLSCEGQNEMQTFKNQNPKTNADIIRGLSNEALIPVVMQYACRHIISLHQGCPCSECDDCIMQWLKQEVKTNDER